MKEVTAKKVRKLVVTLRPDMHKYSRGLCELVVGSERYPGAGILAARAANLMGAGYVKVYSYASVAEALRIVQPSIVCVSEAEYVLDAHVALPDRPCATVVGSGMVCAATSENMISPQAVSTRRVLDVLRETKAPVVVDAGGLVAIASKIGLDSMNLRYDAGFATVITPHYGEALRLLNMTGLNADSPQEMCRILAQYYKAVCVLKGPDTFIARPDALADADVYVMRQGTAVLAKAGTGDVLAGMIGSLLAQGLAAIDACKLASFVHATAGLLCYEAFGVCTTTEHILDAIPEAMQVVSRRQLPDISSRKD